MKYMFFDGSIPWGCHPMRNGSFIPDSWLEPDLPTVTVIVATYGGRHDLHGLVNYTFSSQSYPESKLDLLILDDDSTEDSPLAQYWKQHPRVEYVRIEGKHPIGWKRNWLLGRAKGEVIAQFDDDDFYNTDYVRFMVEYLQKQRNRDLKLVKMASWVNIYPSSENFDQYSGKSTFDAACAEWPNNGFAFAWVYFRDVHPTCEFGNLAYGEEDQFLECLLDKYGYLSVHQIGDFSSQLIKVDTCAGITSQGAISRAWKKTQQPFAFDTITEENLIGRYGQTAWRALNELGLAHVDFANCVGRDTKGTSTC